MREIWCGFQKKVEKDGEFLPEFADADEGNLVDIVSVACVCVCIHILNVYVHICLYMFCGMEWE